MKRKVKSMSEFSDYDDWVAHLIGTSQKRIKSYLELILSEFKKDGDIAALLVGLRQVAKASGGLSEVSNKAGLTREALYRILSKDGNPTLITLQSILGALGYQLSLRAIPTKKAILHQRQPAVTKSSAKQIKSSKRK